MQSMSTKFTIYDVVFTMTDKISSLKLDCNIEMEKIEVEIEKCLSNDYTFRDVSPSEIMAGLNKYNDQFKQYVEAVAEKEWWSQLLTRMEDISKDRSKEYKSLRNKKEILENYMVGEMITFSFCRQREKQSNFIDLDNLIRTFSSKARFSAEDLLLILQERNREYGEDVNVEKSKTPIMLMVVSKDIPIDDNIDNIDTGWELLKTSYLPQWITYQIRIYNLNV